MLVIGLAGGIGSGKSLLASMLGELGARVLNADEINHEVLRRKDIVERIAARWGDDMLDESGRLNRSKLAAKVFQDESEVRELERILHPEVCSRIRRSIAEESESDKIRAVVIDAPLLFEAGLAELCDRIIFIESPEEARRERVTRERGWDSEELSRRERHQMSSSDKKERADIIISNSGSKEDLRKQVERLWEGLFPA